MPLSDKPAFSLESPLQGKAPFLILAFFLFVAIDALYGKFLWNPLVFDDFNFFNSKMAQHYAQIHFDLRWFPYASLAWTQRLFGDMMIWYRLGNLLLHFFTSLALFLFLRRLFNVVLKENGGLSNDWLAFFSALIFALNPVAVYAAGYLVERSIVMAAGFGFLMLLAYMEGVVGNRKTWLLASAIFYLLAVFSKEHAVMLPAVALALTFLLQKPSMQWVKTLWLPFLLYAVIGLLVLMKARGVLGTPYEVYGESMIKSENINVSHAYSLSVLTQGWLFFKYLALWLFPDPSMMSVDMREPFASGYFSMPQVVGFVAFAIYPLIAIRLLLKGGRAGLAGFGLLFPWLLFMTELSTVRIQESFVLYRSYLWVGGLFAAMPFVFSKIPSKASFVILLASSLILFPLARDRLISFSSEYRLWSDASRLVQGREGLVGLDRIYYNLGRSGMLEGHYSEAVTGFSKAIAISPNIYQIWYNRGYAYYSDGQFDKAIADFDRTLDLNAAYAKAYFMRGLAYRRMKKEMPALSDFRKSCILGNSRGCEKVNQFGGNEADLIPR